MRRAIPPRLRDQGRPVAVGGPARSGAAAFGRGGKSGGDGKGKALGRGMRGITFGLSRLNFFIRFD